MSSRLPLLLRCSSLLCGLLYLPLGLVWAYWLALLALPLAALGFWFLHLADHLERAACTPAGIAPRRLRAFNRGLIFTGMAASLLALVATLAGN